MKPRDRRGDSAAEFRTPEGRFAPIAANLGPFPAGFASFALGPDGKVTGFRLALAEQPDQPFEFALQ
jgi:hypothetical protein